MFLTNLRKLLTHSKKAVSVQNWQREIKLQKIISSNQGYTGSLFKSINYVEMLSYASGFF